MSFDFKDLRIPQINWEKAALSEDEVKTRVQQALECLINSQILRRSSRLILHRDTLDQIRKVGDGLEALKENFSNVTPIIQNILAEEIKKRAQEDGDSKTLFNRFEILLEEAFYQESVVEKTKEWLDNMLKKYPDGDPVNIFIQSHLVKLLVNPKTKEYRYFLPPNWKNKTQTATAKALKELWKKANETWMSEKGIRRSETKPETPTQTFLPEEPKTKTRKPKTKKAKKDEADVKAAKRAKTVKAKAREEEDEVDVKQFVGKRSAKINAEGRQEDSHAELHGKLPLDIVKKK